MVVRETEFGLFDGREGHGHNVVGFVEISEKIVMHDALYLWNDIIFGKRSLHDSSPGEICAQQRE